MRRDGERRRGEMFVLVEDDEMVGEFHARYGAWGCGLHDGWR